MRKFAFAIGTLMLIGAGCAATPAPESSSPTAQAPKENGAQMAQGEVYKDAALGFRLTATPDCVKQYAVTTDKNEKGNDVYHVMLPLSKEWTSGVRWYDLEAMPRSSYDAIPVDEPPGRPGIVTNLADGRILIQRGPQDGPSDIGGCGFLKAETTK